MNEPEIERVFRAIDPAAGLDNGGLDSVFNVDELMGKINEGIRANVPIKTGRRWRRFRRGFAVPLALLLIASGTAAAVSLLRSPEPIRLSATMACYSQPVKRAQLIEVVDLTTTPGKTCQRALRASLKSGTTAPNFTLPELCVSNDDVLRVFPNVHAKNLCDSLGYAPYSGKVIVDSVTRLAEAARAFNTSHQCVSIQVGTADANQILTTNALARSWNVTVINRTPSVPSCATLAVDDVHKMIDVVGVPPSLYACGGSDIKVVVNPQVVERHRRSAYVIRVVNESGASCTLSSYADVTLFASGSTVPIAALRAPNGYIGGPLPSNAGGPLPIVSVATGRAEASFLLKFTATPTSCAIQYQNLSVRLNGDTKVHTFRLHHLINGCVRPFITFFAKGSRGLSQ
ncbi:MAG TPA: hypothetical protein VII60_08690 [Acidimicrobiales bacterium]